MPTQTRKLAAILFSDIVGYTRLVAADEARGAEVRDQHRRLLQTLVAQFHGDWVEETGDEGLAVFSSSLDAVHCALAIQAALVDDPDLKVRIGIHIGDVLERDGKLIGDAVNIAARIRPIAEPGGICVSVRVYEDVRSHPEIAATLVGEREFKNVDTPVRVYAIMRSDGATVAPRTPRRTGRTLGIAAGLLVLLGVGYALYEPVRDAIVIRLVRSRLLVPVAPWRDAIAFTTSSDGVRIAYASYGEGPPIVMVLGWVSHIEYPTLSGMIEGLSGHRLVLYDGRGTGLSDKRPSDFSLEAKLRDLEAVVAAAGLERFALYGVSAGGPTSVAYAARHPERVTRVGFYGTFARLSTLPGQLEQWKALVPVVRNGWGQDNPAYRQVFTSLFMPDGSELAMSLFNEFQAIAASPDDAADFIDSLTRTDVRELARQVRAPTLVVHLRGDQIVPFESGRELASLMPGARLVSLEGNNHAILPGDPAGPKRDEALRGFFGGDLEPAPPSG